MQTVPSTQDASICQLEPGSFRDRHGRIYYGSGKVLRGISAEALSDWETVSSTDFFRRLSGEGKIVRTYRLDRDDTPELGGIRDWAAVLAHDLIPFISYPYEWCFGMLKDAALLQLEALDAAMEEAVILKDATPFNIQWVGGKPVFIDIPSFTKIAPGQVWIGYQQFCRMFLYPLMLQAYKNVAFQPWLRGSLEGISPADCRNLMSTRDLLRRGVLLHVWLQAVLQDKLGDSRKDVRGDIQASGFSTAMIQANVRRLRKLVSRLRWKDAKSEWSDYASDNSYSDPDAALKESFVREVTRSRPRDLVWDLGCNTGTFSRVAAETAGYVIAMDSDHLAVERLYRSLKTEQNESILPLLMNLGDPSPNRGWRGLERKALVQRGRPDLTLCLALIHHMVISANVPLAEFVQWLADLGGDLVIEFVTKDDPMVKQLLLNKEDQYGEYETGFFERCLAESFDIRRRQRLESGSRVLYFAENKGP